MGTPNGFLTRKWINMPYYKFHESKGKLWTYTYPNKDKVLIDYIIMNKKCINCALDCEVYSSFEGVYSDNHIVTAKIRSNLQRNTTLTTKTIHLSLFNNRDLGDNGLGVRVFANGPGDLGSIPGRVIPKTQKMVLDASLHNTQHYKVRIKGKVEQSREGVAPSPTHWCSSYRKGSLRVTLDYGRQLYFLLRNKYDAQQKISGTLTPNDEYGNFIYAHVEEAAECITTKLRTKHTVP